MRLGFRHQASLEDRLPKAIKLGVKIKDFGPIANAAITLKPLTIFIGPNNSGKSYASMLIHSLVSSYAMTHNRPFGMPLQDKPGKIIDKLKKLIEDAQSANASKIAIPKPIIDEIAQSYYEYIFNKKLPLEICKNFGSDTDRLVRIGMDEFEITLSKDIAASMTYRDSFNTTKLPKLSLNVVLQQKKDSKLGSFEITANANNMDEIKHDMVAIDHISQRDIFVPVVFNTICDIVLERIASTLPSRVHYFPASRSGILQAHKTISASIIRNAPYGGIKQMLVPQLSGPISDFLSSIIEMPKRKGELFGMAEKLERDLLGGKISLHADAQYGIPEIRYAHLDTDVPLYRASSAVTELAPFVLYLKYMVGRNSMLIIEEPEAHLHPHNQRILARYIVKLVRQGLNILVTTHSIFMLTQFSQFLRMGNMDEEHRSTGLGWDKDDYLSEDEVSSYVFEAKRSGGYRVKEIESSTKDGISQEEFTRIALALGEENNTIN